MSVGNGGVQHVGAGDFIERFGLYTEEQAAAADDVRGRLASGELRSVRVVWADQHGVSRGKLLSARDFETALSSGMDFQGAALIMDTGNHVFTPLFVQGGGFGIPEFTGFPDVVLVPDPTTFRTIPWAPGEAWVLSDMYFRNGKPVPFSTRAILRSQVQAAADLGYGFVAGLEVEFYITVPERSEIRPEETGQPPPPPAVRPVAQGYQYLSESRLVELAPILRVLRDNLEALGLPLRTMEDEWGPGQCEFTFGPVAGVSGADNMLLFRTATKQLCRLHGLHATFMSRPALPNFFSSGWHLHQSLTHLDGGGNAFRSTDGEVLSEVGRHYVAGLIEHAVPMSVFCNPTITGYKRLKPYSFAPDRANWARENRGAMVRVQGEPGEEGTHIENRSGEPAANPYLYLASNLAAGLDGVRRKLTPPPIVDGDPYASESTMLPTTLWEAVDALEADDFFVQEFGRPFIDYLIMAKRSEIGRFLSEVTDWEHREYFEFY